VHLTAAQPKQPTAQAAARANAGLSSSATLWTSDQYGRCWWSSGQQRWNSAFSLGAPKPARHTGLRFVRPPYPAHRCAI